MPDPPALATAAYEDWSLDDSIAFLKQQGVKVKNSQSLEDVRKLVADHADAAAKVGTTSGNREARRTGVQGIILTYRPVGRSFCGLCPGSL